MVATAKRKCIHHFMLPEPGKDVAMIGVCKYCKLRRRHMSSLPYISSWSRNNKQRDKAMRKRAKLAAKSQRQGDRVNAR